MENWCSLRDYGFSNYAVSTEGHVENIQRGRLLAPSRSSRGSNKVNLVRDDGTKYTASIARLVAEVFISNPDEDSKFIIHLNGDKTDCRMENLAWRPFWFAHEYHRQFTKYHRPLVFGAIKLVETDEVFEHSWEPAMKYGLIEKSVLHSLYNGIPVYPTWHHFVFLEE